MFGSEGSKSSSSGPILYCVIKWKRVDCHSAKWWTNNGPCLEREPVRVFQHALSLPLAPHLLLLSPRLLHYCCVIPSLHQCKPKELNKKWPGQFKWFRHQVRCYNTDVSYVLWKNRQMEKSETKWGPKWDLHIQEKFVLLKKANSRNNACRYVRYTQTWCKWWRKRDLREFSIFKFVLWLVRSWCISDSIVMHLNVAK
jgi:hypothetical protein